MPFRKKNFSVCQFCGRHDNVNMHMRSSTLCLLVKENQVLLGMKKRGFGAGKWNGIGGKLEDGETIEQAAVRELEEEIGARAEIEDLKKTGEINFYFKDKPEWNQRVHVFILEKWKGELKESEEMSPRWFLHKEIPFGEMWQDDIHWLPKVLSGKAVKGDFCFTNTGLTLDSFNLEEYTDIA